MKALTRTIVLGFILWLPAASAVAQEPKRDEEGHEKRPIPLPEQKVTAPPLQSPYLAPEESRSGRPLLELPEAITVVPRAVIDEQKALTLEQVLRNVGGVARQAGRGFNDDFLVRGFRPAEGALVLRDQFPQAIDDLSPPAELWNVERVEVLKGPSAFLYGRSEPGGLINLVSKKPLAEPRLFFEVTAGSFDLYRPAVDVTGPIPGTGGHLRYRLTGLYESSESFRDVVDGRRVNVTPALTWRIGADTTITFLFEYQHHDRTRDTGIVALGRRPAGIPIETFLNDRKDRIEVETYRAGYELIHRIAEDWRVRNAFRFVRLMGGFVGTSVNNPNSAGFATRGYSGFDNIVNDGYGVQTDVTGRFTTGPLVHRPLFGIELTRNAFAGDFMTNGAPVPGINIFDPNSNQPLPALRRAASWRIRHDILGLYVQEDLELFEGFRLVGGGRFDFLRERDQDPVLAGTRRRQNFSSFTPRAGVVYQPVPALALYANYSESFQPTAGTNPDGQGFDPVRGKGYDVGVKVDPLKGRLVGTLSLYQITKQNVLNPDPTRTNFRIQSGEERSRGIEVEIAGTVLPGWDVIGAYSYTDARITEDTNVTRVGREKPNVPEHAASLWTRYTFQHGPLRGLSLGGGVFYVGERPGDLIDSYRLPEYVRFDALLGYRFRQFQASLNFQNLTNTTHYVSGGTRTSIFPGAPFSVLGSIAIAY
jgi:iron complex outermembrane receptor protein